MRSGAKARAPYRALSVPVITKRRETRRPALSFAHVRPGREDEIVKPYVSLIDVRFDRLRAVRQRLSWQTIYLPKSPHGKRGTFRIVTPERASPSRTLHTSHLVSP